MAKTPLIKLENFYLKREDLNQTGSAKDRAISLQIDHLKKNGFDQAVISSTGNAAISASYYCQSKKIRLTVFLSPKINPKKLSLIKKNNNQIIFSNKPISDAIKYGKQNNSYLLRQSTDPIALTGYQKIGKEIIDQLPQITSIFIPVGSGTTLLGIYQAIPKTVKIFAVQPASHCPIASLFDKNFIKENNNITDAISVKYLPLKTEIINSIKNSQGSALVVQNKEILDCQKFLKSHNIKTSLEGALALSGFKKAVKNNFDIGSYPVIVLTGCLR